MSARRNTTLRQADTPGTMGIFKQKRLCDDGVASEGEEKAEGRTEAWLPGPPNNVRCGYLVNVIFSLSNLVLPS